MNKPNYYRFLISKRKLESKYYVFIPVFIVTIYHSALLVYANDAGHGQI